VVRLATHVQPVELTHRLGAFRREHRARERYQAKNPKATSKQAQPNAHTRAPRAVKTPKNLEFRA